jgi:hypothetical protein
LQVPLPSFIFQVILAQVPKKVNVKREVNKSFIFDFTYKSGTPEEAEVPEKL